MPNKSLSNLHMVTFSTDLHIVGRLVKDPNKSVAEAIFVPIGGSATRPKIHREIEIIGHSLNRKLQCAAIAQSIKENS